jgi:hypothetical protein
MKRIALVGSAPSSVQLAPFGDKSWEIWSCSPGAYPFVSRCDAHFELHRWEKAPWFSAEYIAWMVATGKPIYMINPVPEIPNSVKFPKDEMLTRFGPFFFASSISWMMALAIASGATEIGLWGIDMSANEEWNFQRSGCHYFIHVAKTMGIKVTLPPQSDLLRPTPLYGYCEEDPLFMKMQVRKVEIDARLQDAMRRESQAHDERMFLMGAKDDIEYQMKTWVSDPVAIAMAYQQPLLMAPEPEIIVADVPVEVTAPQIDLTAIHHDANGAGVSVKKNGSMGAKKKSPRKGKLSNAVATA